MNINKYIYIFSKYMLYVCVFIYTYIINIHSTHIYYVNNIFILNVINRVIFIMYIKAHTYSIYSENI